MDGRRQLGLSFMIHDDDASYSLVLARLWAWWKAVWEEMLPTDILQVALRGASRVAEGAGHLVHSDVVGGASAFLSSLVRIGWRAKGVDVVCTASGLELKVGEGGDLEMLMRLARKDLEVSACAELSLPKRSLQNRMPTGTIGRPHNPVAMCLLARCLGSWLRHRIIGGRSSCMFAESLFRG